MSDKRKAKEVQTTPEWIKMEGDNEKITIRIPKRYLKAIDYLVRADDFPSRSEAIRAAVRDMIYERIELVPDKIQKIQAAEQAVENAVALEEKLLKL